MNPSAVSPSRRHVLTGTASALAAAGLGSWQGLAAAQTAPAEAKPLPGYASWKMSDNLIVHSNLTIETRRSAFGTSVITPANQLYVRSHMPPPDASVLANRDAWEISIEGVEVPRVLTLGQLKRMGLETVATVLQCSGNGRGFFPSKPSGTPWTVGAAGCVVWSGVPVRAVAAALGGVVKGTRFMTGTGGEKLPEGVDPKTVVVERSVPAKAMENALLAWEMNGEPIPLAHGGPLRLVVPGYQGVNNIKYVKRLAFSAEQSDAKLMTHGYRLTPMGEKADPSQSPVWEMGVKSWVNTPNADGAALQAGVTQIQGVAFGGANAVEKVEVSVDGGKSWREARLVGPDLGRFAWRQFVLQVELPAGKHLIASRATDSLGRVQPQAREENLSGYNNTSWSDHAVLVTVV